MGKGLAEATRRQLPQLTEAITQLGMIDSITFKNVGAGGIDVYEVKFERGSTEWRIGMETEGDDREWAYRKL